jgi:hypothetical protein
MAPDCRNLYPREFSYVLSVLHDVVHLLENILIFHLIYNAVKGSCDRLIAIQNRQIDTLWAVRAINEY